jgi:hypothetical protein
MQSLSVFPNETCQCGCSFVYRNGVGVDMMLSALDNLIHSFRFHSIQFNNVILDHALMIDARYIFAHVIVLIYSIDLLRVCILCWLAPLIPSILHQSSASGETV